MRSRIWQLAGVGLLGMGLSLGALAQGPEDPNGGRGSPLNSRDEVRQSQPPRQGYYQDIPRRHGDDRYYGQRPGGDWAGRPDGHGNGWGPGPQYHPGHSVDRFPDRYWKVPYRGQDYFYSGGYWYRPHGGGYVVVRPPYGVRVGYLPPYAREVWQGARCSSWWPTPTTSTRPTVESTWWSIRPLLCQRLSSSRTTVMT